MKRISGSGARIKKLRTDLGLKQVDIASDKVSKSLICMIETNRRSLTYSTAVVIAEELNKHYEPLGKKVSVDYLLETEEDRIRKDIHDQLDQVEKKMKTEKIDDKQTTKLLENILGKINKWHLKEDMQRFQQVRGDFNYHQSRYNEALGDYISLLSEYIQNKEYDEMASMYMVIGTTYQMQMMTETALIYYMKAFETAAIYYPSNKEKIKIQSLFNQILCYGRMKRYDLVLSHIKSFKTLKSEDPFYEKNLNQVLVVEANTYRDLMEYKKAEKIYLKLLQKEKALDKHTQFLLLENFSVFHRQQGDIPTALNYIERAYGIKDGVDPNYMPALYLYKARCYHILQGYHEVLKLLEEGLELAQKVSNSSIIVDIYFTYGEVYIKLKDYSTALKYLKQAEKIIVDYDLKVKQQDLYSFYSDVYMMLEEKERASEYQLKMRRSYLEFD